MGKPYHNRQHFSYRERSVDIREIQQRFLIICEGEKTEPNYFIKFRTPKTVIKVKIENCDIVSLVKQAINYKSMDNYDQVWCVFDKDEKSSDNFISAIEFAGKNEINVAYSNEAFELWYFLHYDYLDTGISRADYCEKLNLRLGKKYEKNDESIYEILLPKQKNAIKHARKLLNQYNPPNPATDNPSTTVFRLVEELRKYSINS